jgi:NTP pyrophosphatase (non-canonical NTP hydrolase)
MDLQAIQVREFEDTTHYFPEHEDSVAYLATALAGEVGETCNEIKKFLRGDFDNDPDFKPSQVLMYKLQKELPDILIYLVMLSTKVGVDLEAAYKEKKRFNDERFGHPNRSATI